MKITETLLHDIDQFKRESVDIKETNWWYGDYCVKQMIPGSSGDYMVGIKDRDLDSINFFAWGINDIDRLQGLLTCLTGQKVSLNIQNKCNKDNQLEMQFPD